MHERDGAHGGTDALQALQAARVIEGQERDPKEGRDVRARLPQAARQRLRKTRRRESPARRFTR